MSSMLHRNLSTNRTARRFTVSKPSTLRLPTRVPLDVLIDDLSTHGCRVLTNRTFELGNVIRIGLPGLGVRFAEVRWVQAGSIGCEFEKPLSPGDIEEIKIAQTVVQGIFANECSPLADEDVLRLRFSRAQKAGLVMAGAVVSWSLLALLGWAAIRLIQI